MMLKTSKHSKCTRKDYVGTSDSVNRFEVSISKTPKMFVTNPYSGRNLRDLKQTITSVYLKRREKTGAIKSVQLPCGKKLRPGMCAVDVTGEAAAAAT